MRVLLDENLDWQLSRDLPGHHVDSVPKIGRAGIKNGELLRRTQDSYDVLLTMDVGIAYQHSVRSFRICIIALRSGSNRLADTRPLMPEVLRVLPLVQPGTITFVPK